MNFTTIANLIVSILNAIAFYIIVRKTPKLTTKPLLMEEPKTKETETQTKETETQTKETETKEPEPKTTTEKDPNIWYVSPDNLTRYKGEWKNGLPNGKGVREIFETPTKDYSIIEGNFVDGFTHGHGRQTFRKTWEKMTPYYEGEFHKNNYHGFGEYHYGCGAYYKGEWSNNKANGKGGEYSIILDRTWVGTFLNDKRVVGEYYGGKV
jgi:hypothetical protein